MRSCLVLKETNVILSIVCHTGRCASSQSGGGGGGGSSGSRGGGGLGGLTPPLQRFFGGLSVYESSHGPGP